MPINARNHLQHKLLEHVDQSAFQGDILSPSCIDATMRGNAATQGTESSGYQSALTVHLPPLHILAIHDRHVIPVAEEARALKRLGGALVLADMSVEDAEPHVVGIDGTQSPRAANGAGRPGEATTATAGDELVPDEARCLAVDAAAGWVGVKSVGGEG